MAKTRVLVADDSLTVRKYLAGLVQSDPALELVGEADNGKAAIELTEQLRPDVITLDMMMPVMTGLAATEYIMAYCPTPILIVSASTNRGELMRTYDALAAGAVDVLDKTGSIENPAWERKYLSTVKMVSRIKVITHPRGRLNGSRAARTPQMPLPEGTFERVAIGASTGGPSAVLEVLRGLGESFPLPVLLVIHIGEPFGLAMAEWLDGLSPLRVRVAQDGEPLPGRGESGVIMAPHERHLEVAGGRLRLSSGPERHSCRPSVDVLFESLAREAGSSTIACLLTGMGRDGARGMLAIKQAGGVCIAQDEATSVIFGMPREAIVLNAATHVLPVGGVAPMLTALATSRRASDA